MKPLKVSELNRYIKRTFSSDMILSNIQIEGEISNLNKHVSGHIYFHLKDEKSSIKCVMFKENSRYNNINIFEGQKIVAEGYVSIYEKKGEYQLYIRNIKSYGVGELYEKYEKLKEKLEKEGLFENKYKQKLPFLPKKIGVITSPTGAAVHDIISTINRRYPSCKILIYPSLVQGSNAPKKIINALKTLDNNKSIEVIIVARGGGTIDDLFCFNDEELARFIFSLKTPVISAIGHETDFTIIDFIADLRAPTPSIAAELAVPDIVNVTHDLNFKFNYIKKTYLEQLKYKKNIINTFKNGLKYNNPYFKLRNNKQDIDMLLKDLMISTNNNISKRSQSLFSLGNKLQFINPLLPLEKGCGLCIDKNGHIIKSIKDFKLNSLITVRLKDGKLKVKIKEIIKENN